MTKLGNRYFAKCSEIMHLCSSHQLMLKKKSEVVGIITKENQADRT